MLPLLMPRAVVGLAFLMVYQAQASMPRKDNTVCINYPTALPFDLDGAAEVAEAEGRIRRHPRHPSARPKASACR